MKKCSSLTGFARSSMHCLFVSWKILSAVIVLSDSCCTVEKNGVVPIPRERQKMVCGCIFVSPVLGIDCCRERLLVECLALLGFQ